jgi:O-antigen/teichoic acid export membrane protein
MDAEQREFAKNQTYIEIWLKITLGCIALSGAAVIALAVYLAAHPIDDFAILLIVLLFGVLVVGVYSTSKFDYYRRKLDEKEAPKEKPKETTPKLQDQLMPTKEG